MKTKLRKKTCKKCGYSYTPRVQEPKECPNCKTRFKITIKKVN